MENLFNLFPKDLANIVIEYDHAKNYDQVMYQLNERVYEAIQGNYRISIKHFNFSGLLNGVFLYKKCALYFYKSMKRKEKEPTHRLK